jgi:uncharacterized protein YjbI with pentapeptide repeats
MANPEHLAILKQGGEQWNKWRKEHTAVEPNLVGAKLMRADLSGANLWGAMLIHADLSGANFRLADLSGANLRWAKLSGREAHPS